MMSEKSEKAKQYRQFIIISFIILGILGLYNSYQINALNNSVATMNGFLATGNVAIGDTAKAIADSDNGEGAKPTAKAQIDMDALIGGNAIKGDSNAPVTIVEWSDFECPFCKRFYDNTLSQIITNYIDTGKVRLIYRDFPLNFHPQAQKAAEAVECAGEQKKYWEMHNKMFEEGVVGGVATFKQYAVDLGLNTVDFNSCLDNGDMVAEIAKDIADGSAVGIKGTPGFIINGELLSGAQPYANFKAVIDRKLAEAGAN